MNIEVGCVYFSNDNRRPRFRRIVAVFNGFVYYSDGSDRNDVCRLSDFVNWIWYGNASMPVRGV